MQLTKKQAFLAMFYLLAEYYHNNKYDKNKVNDLGALLGSINPYLFEGEMPADLAALDDWEKSLESIGLNKSDEYITQDNAFEGIIAFLEYYTNEFGFKLNEVINELRDNDLFQGSIGNMWANSINKVVEIIG